MRCVGAGGPGGAPRRAQAAAGAQRLHEVVRVRGRRRRRLGRERRHAPGPRHPRRALGPAAGRERWKREAGGEAGAGADMGWRRRRRSVRGASGFTVFGIFFRCGVVGVRAADGERGGGAPRRWRSVGIFAVVVTGRPLMGYAIFCSLLG